VVEQNAAKRVMTIRLLGREDGTPTEFDGEYVVEYDPTPRFDEEGEYVHIATTSNPAKARQFPNIEQAVEFYLLPSQSGSREDGEPNRPLTAYNVEIG
jgi:hypothetical protein